MPVFTNHIDHLFGNPEATKSLHQDHEALCCNNYGSFFNFGDSKPHWKFARNRSWCLQILWFVKLYKWKSMQTKKSELFSFRFCKSILISGLICIHGCNEL